MALAPKFAKIVADAAQEARNAKRYVAANRIESPVQTVAGPLRNEYPLVYSDPSVIRAWADINNAPESPMLPAIFGVTRRDLASMAADPRRQAMARPAVLPGLAANPSGARFAERLATPENARRISNQLSALRESAIEPGMTGWYVMDPAYELLLDYFKGDKAKASEAFNRFNITTAMMSPGSDVVTEIARGGNANVLAQRGRLQDFESLGDMIKAKNVPPEMAHIPGHVYHTTSHRAPLRRAVQQNLWDPFQMPMGSPKVSPYAQASSVPEVGFQINHPVGDAHYARGIGVADLRAERGPTFNQREQKWEDPDYGASLSNSEAYTARQFFAPIAAQNDLTPVQAQGLLWGGLGPATGVETAVGAPKLELIADYVANSVMPRHGIADPKLAAQRFLAGEIGSADPRLLAGIAGLSGAGMYGYDQYRSDKRPKFLDLIAPPQ